MLLEIVRCLAAAGVGLVLGRSLSAGGRSAETPVGRDWRRVEATIACNPLQVIGGSRRGPGDGGSA